MLKATAFVLGCAICGGFLYLLPKNPAAATGVLALYVPIGVVALLAKRRSTTLTSAAVAAIALLSIPNSAEAHWVCQQWHYRTCVRSVWVAPPPPFYGQPYGNYPYITTAPPSDGYYYGRPAPPPPPRQTVYGPTTTSPGYWGYEGCRVNGVLHPKIPARDCHPR